MAIVLWPEFSRVTANQQSFDFDIPEGIALSLHTVTLQRMEELPDPDSPSVNQLVANGNPGIVTIDGQSNFGVVTQGKVVQIFKEGELVHELSFKDKAGNEVFVGGTKTDQIAFSADDRLMFIAGTKGEIYVLDTALMKLVHSFTVEGSTCNISSLAVSGKWLYVAEGSNYSIGSSYRLMRVNIDKSDASFLKAQQIHLPSEVSGGSAPLGYIDLAVARGGEHTYLTVTASKASLAITHSFRENSGQAFVIDLDKLTVSGDKVEAQADAYMPITFSGGQGRGPQYINSAGVKEGQLRLLLSDAIDYNQGLATVSVGLSKSGALPGSAEAKTIMMTGVPSGEPSSSRLGNKYQLNLQRAQSPVITRQNGIEYALVADYYFDFLEPGYRAGLLADKQAGGKVGIIKDPFGTPTYLGATTPILDASINQLQVGEDGRTLWADVRCWSGLGEAALPHGMLQWDLSALIQSAEEHSIDAQGKTFPIPVDQKERGVLAVTPIKFNLGNDNKGTSGWLFGMARSQTLDSVALSEAEGTLRYGDVGYINLSALIKAQYKEFSNSVISGFNDDTVSVEGGALVRDKNGKIVWGDPKGTGLVKAASDKSYNESADNPQKNQGVIFVAPQITDEMLISLRKGDNLNDYKSFVTVPGSPSTTRRGAFRSRLP